jgi:hypothetical protein
MEFADQLVSNLEGLTLDSLTSESERVRVRNALFRALRSVQSPWDIAWEQNWVNGATNASVKTLIDAGVFNKWIEIGGKPAKAEDLAGLVEADPVLISEFTHSSRPLGRGQPIKLTCNGRANDATDIWTASHQ